MAQSDATYPKGTPLFIKHSSGLDEGYSASQGSSLSTGDLRRRYNFADRFSELAIEQTPFFRLVSKIGKKPTDDPSFKFTEKRQSWMKRYAYVVGWLHGSTDVFNNAEVKNSSNQAIAAGGEVKLYMATDYFSAGNIQNISGQSNGAIKIGDAGTAPEFLQKQSIIKVNMSSTAKGGTSIDDYMLVRITAVGAQAAKNLSGGGGSSTAEVKLVTGTVLRASSGTATELCSFSNDLPVCVAYDKTIHSDLEAKRSYVVGNSHQEGSELIGETWKDNPYSTGYGQTQIFRSEFGMTNTARATVLKYEPNEWARVWKDKLIEHKWDIEQAALFSTQYTAGSGDSAANHTQGAVDYVLNYGNLFTLTHSSKTIDGFLDDMSKYVDPRYNSQKATVYFCDTETYNWMHKLGGFFKNNIEIGSQYRADLAVAGRKKVMGLDVTVFSTVYGDINVTRCIALDGSGVKILGVNMNNVKYRPLVGNGVNRDTSIYVGVQDLSNSGVDKRVDMILTEAGFEWQMPESHAIWK